jgi:mRNA interferase MazF
MVENEFPKQGDLVWITLDPTRGHEQSGRRPAVVVSKDAYNKLSGMMLICPITSKSKIPTFEIPFASKKIKGNILIDHVRSVDWHSPERKCEIITSLSIDILQKVCRKISRLIEIS